MPLDRTIRSMIMWRRVSGVEPELEVAAAREQYRASAIRDRVLDPVAAVADLDADGVPVRVYTPQTDRGLVVTYFHGGGFIVGDLDTHDPLCRTVAATLGAVVVSVQYRRAPENPYPAPILDAVTAAAWTARSYGERPHVLAGDSAGACLVLNVAMAARDAGAPAFAAQLLLYPPVDPTLASESMWRLGKGYLLTARELAWFYDLYVPDEADRSDPKVALLHADLSGLAPTVVGTAEFDPLLDEGLELVARLAAAGVEVHHVAGDGLIHGYALITDLVPAAAHTCAQLLHTLQSVLGSGVSH